MTFDFRKTKITFVALAFVACIFIVAAALLWRPMLETGIKNALEARGFENVRLTVAVEDQGALSFKDVELGAPTPLSIENLTVAYTPLAVLTGKKGAWHIKKLEIKNDAFPLLALNGDGMIFAGAGQVMIEGKFESTDHAYKMNFRMDYSIRDPARRELVIVSAVMPWKGGTVATRDMKIRLEGKQALDVILTLDRVSTDALLGQLTAKKAAATGTLSGTLPLTIDTDGSISVHNGELQAQEAGIVILSPDVIPGNSTQVNFVREVMKDFHYSLFSVHVDSAKDNRLAVLITLHGYNPAVQAGRRVELNVRLTGDMLNFVKQNFIWLSDPQKLLERGQNENNK